MRQKSCHRLVYKLPSSMLKKANWKLYLPLKTAMDEYKDCIVALNESQCLRFIDEINGTGDINAPVNGMQKKIRAEKRKPKSKETKRLISAYYDRLYELQFMRDYLCVVMDTNSDYDRANQGFSIDFGEVDGKPCIIHYRRFLGTNGGIKTSTIVYVNEQIYPELKRRLDNGRDPNKELVPAKLEAYQALICSGSIPLPEPRGFIVINDCITHFKEDVILINDEGDGEPVMTEENEYEIEHNDSDGYGLMTPAYASIVNEYLIGDSSPVSGMNTRYAWTKGMVYTFDFVRFAEEVAGTYIIKDAWGEDRDVRDADVILTVSMLKLWDSYDSWEDYYRNCQLNHYRFATTKITPKELEGVRDTNYQFLQSYAFSDEDINVLCKPTIDEIKDVVGLDYRKSLVFLIGFGLTEENILRRDFDWGIKALMVEPEMINDPYIRNRIWNMIHKRIEAGKRGAVRINANFAMISGDPYALCQSMFGLDITGILKAGEVYHKYWIDKGADEIACFRAPMTCHNNIRRMKLNKSELAEKWFQYMKTVVVLNAFDTCCDATNGADKDGDTYMCTDNPTILHRTRNDKTIMCVQRKAAKMIPAEEDIVTANKLAFNDDIGIVTNHITSMFDVQAGFPVDSPEYKTLSYRIMCGQLYQQNTIDRAKGVIAKSMPEYWYSHRDNRIKDDDPEEVRAQKKFNEKIVAARKPYFMSYVYRNLRTQYNAYIKGNNDGAVRRFYRYKIKNLSELKAYQNDPEVKEYINYFDRLMPLGMSGCVVNRICRLFESEFDGYITRMYPAVDFDYSILRSDVGYSQAAYSKIKELYAEYLRQMDAIAQSQRYEHFDDFELGIKHEFIADLFRSQSEMVCSNEDELCDIVIDLCYKSEKSKQFAWDMCGEVMFRNLLKHSDGFLHFPVLVENDGEFTYCGRRFEMKEAGVTDDNTE